MISVSAANNTPQLQSLNSALLAGASPEPSRRVGTNEDIVVRLFLLVCVKKRIQANKRSLARLFGIRLGFLLFIINDFII